MNERPRLFAVVLAGGIGSRFWPASTPDRPKQLLPLGSDRPLIADTIERAVHLAGLDRLLVVTGAALVDPFRSAVPELEAGHFLVEPAARGTGPALVWAAHQALGREPDSVMVSLHADHVISPLPQFSATVAKAANAASRQRRLYCVGVRPTRPETGYGYVRAGRSTAPGVFDALEFVEKPDRATAEEYLASGDYLWNSGIFVWRPRDLLEAVDRFTPEMAGALELLDASDVEGFYRRVRPVTIDVGVMERANRVGVVEATFHWDDVGAWNALARTRETDTAGNVLVGKVDALDSHDNIAWVEDGRVALFGVRDLVVVRVGDRTLVTTRVAAPDLKRLLERLESDT